MSTLRTLIAATVVVAGVTSAVAAPASAKCTRLGFSVNDYGKEGPTNDAKRLLDGHIAQWAQQNGIAKYTVGKKSVNCELFLDFIVFDEHTCRAEADVCWNETAKPAAAQSAEADDKPAKAVKKPVAKTVAKKPAAAAEADAAEKTAAEPAVQAAEKKPAQPVQTIAKPAPDATATQKPATAAAKPVPAAGSDDAARAAAAAALKKATEAGGADITTGTIAKPAAPAAKPAAPATTKPAAAPAVAPQQ